MGESLRAPEELEVAILKSSEKLIRALETIYAELGNQMLEVNVFKQFLAEFRVVLEEVPARFLAIFRKFSGKF